MGIDLALTGSWLSFPTCDISVFIRPISFCGEEVEVKIPAHGLSGVIIQSICSKL